MPAHYALSDAAIVLVAIWGVIALSQTRLTLPAFAMACFGIAAAIGVVRFSAGLQAELALAHATASTVLGLAGAAALAIACLRRGGGRGDLPITVALLVLAGALAVFAPALIAPLFVLAGVTALLTTLWRGIRNGSGWLAPTGFALLLANVLLIRRAPWLSEATAWHAYHLLIALALAMVTMALRPNEARVFSAQSSA
ncbi:MAG: hypothetical protein ACKO1N_06570 [Erythrobacter sp.]